MIPDLNLNKQRIRATHFTEIVYLKQRQEFGLVAKNLNLCPVMPASRRVNPPATSHTAEHLASICLHSWSHDKPIFYFISHFLNKKRHCLEPLITIKYVFFNTAITVIYFRLYLGNVTLQDVKGPGI